MIPLGKGLRTSLAAMLVLVGLASGAHGFGVDSLDLFTNNLGTGRAGIQVKGKVVCVECSLPEARAAQSHKYSNHFYQFAHQDEQVVIEVNWVSNTRRWHHVTVPRIRVRGQTSLFQQLMAEENLFKEVKITGILSSAQVLDLHEVTILG